MAKLVFLLKRKAGISPEQFRQHYESSHVPMAHKYIGHLLTDYVRNYPILAALDPSNVTPGTSPAPHDFGYDAITEMRVRDAAAIEEIGRIFNDPAVQPILKDDERKFLDDKATVMIICDEVESAKSALMSSLSAQTN